MISLCILVPACSVSCRLVYSLLPGVSVHVSLALPCPALPCRALMSPLKSIIWVYVLVCVSLFLPAVCTVTEDQTTKVSGAPSPRFVRFLKSFYFVPVCLSRGKEVATHPSALARVKSAWEFGRIVASAASPLAASPPARRSRGISAAVRGSPSPPFAGDDAAVRGSPSPPFTGDDAAVRGSPSPPFAGDDTPARRPAAASSPPDRR